MRATMQDAPPEVAAARHRIGPGPLGTLLLSMLLGACAPGGPSPEPELRFVANDTSNSFGHFVFGPISESFLESAEDPDRDDVFPTDDVFRVFVGEPVFQGDSCTPEAHPGDSATSIQPSLIGRVQRNGNVLEFVPRFPLSTERIYTACLDLSQLQDIGDITSSASAPRHIARSPATERSDAPNVGVTRVWPPSGSVPANLLRIYVEFDRRMEARGVADHIQLLRDGKPINDAFVAIPDGLWDPKIKRLTLFLHPGRIKRGVGPHETQGPVLVAGDRVSLKLGDALRSADGATLKESYEVQYLVAENDRILPSPNSWSVKPPRGSDGAVRVLFDEPLDPGILARFAEVWNEEGDLVEGHQAASSDGRSWQFTPHDPWTPGSYEILASSEVEDLAGNTPNRVFDRATGASPSDGQAGFQPPPSEPLSFDFLVE